MCVFVVEKLFVRTIAGVFNSTLIIYSNGVGDIVFENIQTRFSYKQQRLKRTFARLSRKRTSQNSCRRRINVYFFIQTRAHLSSHLLKHKLFDLRVERIDRRYYYFIYEPLYAPQKNILSHYRKGKTFVSEKKRFSFRPFFFSRFERNVNLANIKRVNSALLNLLTYTIY